MAVSSVVQCRLQNKLKMESELVTSWSSRELLTDGSRVKPEVPPSSSSASKFFHANLEGSGNR